MAIGEIMTLVEAERQYPDEWVMLEITHDAVRREDAKGRLLGHSSERSELDEAYRRFREEKPKALVAEFWTGELFPKDGVVML